ncbi:hypothetical protein B4099_1471 [Heyndrickxia coagulans]|uniref:Uncharacterized protein n=1 Tax=Heyndrickxia coagulans TaxID=1398 RepID=A0A150KI92_HEYCO|nr:hypothetical protein B4099_1471 [Heyndrickxia coagulans]
MPVEKQAIFISAACGKLRAATGIPCYALCFCLIFSKIIC